MPMTYTGPGEFLTITEDKDPSVVRRHIGRYEKAVALAARTGGRWIDCACGTAYGSDTIFRSAHPHSYVGIDCNADAINYACDHYGGGLKEFAWLRIEDAADWMPVYGSADVILSLETLEHLTPDVQESWVEAAAGGLTVGGVFIVACPIGNDGPSEYNRYHLHEPSLDGLNALLSPHFKSIEIETEEYVDTGGHDAVQAFAVCR